MRMTVKKQYVMATIVVAGLCRLNASTLMIDLGGGTTYTGTNSPGHVEGTISMSETTWHGFEPPTSGTSVDYLNATFQTSDAVDVGIHFGRNHSGDPDKLDWKRPGALVDDTSGSGIFGTDLTRDAVFDFDPATATYRDPIGFMITGLLPGEYYVYTIAHYAGNQGTSYNLLATSAPTIPDDTDANNPDVLDIYSFANPQLVAVSGSNGDFWEQENNYARFTISITGVNDALYIFSDQAEDSIGHASLSGIQIVTIPEPSSLLLLLLSFAGFMTLRRRFEK